MKHEQNQNARLNALQGQVSLLSAKLEDNKEALKFTSSVTPDGFDYLALGNSITLHGITDFWWGEWGMAASALSSDYYHKVVDRLKSKKGSDINSVAYNYHVWEVQAHDRGETHTFLDKYLVDGIDLITLQLSENAADLRTFSEDLESLLRYIKDKCPNAQLVVVDDFWSAEKSAIKKAVCEKLKIGFVDLSEIRGKQEYMAGMGTVVLGADEKEHTILHAGVASHPNDKGMTYIAEGIVGKVQR